MVRSLCLTYSVIQVLKNNTTWFFFCIFYVEVVENDEEECDTDLERQNVEELYDYVRHLHQRESQEVAYDVQDKALIPVLRPYQSQAVNWMLRREKYRSTSPKGTTIHHFPSVGFLTGDYDDYDHLCS